MISSILLAGCTPVPPEQTERTEQTNRLPPSPETTVQPQAPLTPTSAFLAGCTNVKSYSFNMGGAVGTRICLEGVVDKVTLPSTGQEAEIEFDTVTGKSSGSLYSVTVVIADRNAFGLDNINQLAKGNYIAVNGLFTQGITQQTYIANFIIKISQSDELIVLS